MPERTIGEFYENLFRKNAISHFHPSEKVERGTNMEIASPAFGLISGIGNSLGLLPNILTLFTLLFIGIPTGSTASLIAFTIVAKLLGEWLFWTHCKRRMDDAPKLKQWRRAFDQSLFSHPHVFTALFMMFADGLVDATLVCIALKTSIPPIWIFLTLFGCQMLSSSIQGFLSDYFSQKKSMLFASLIGMIAIALAAEISIDGKTSEASIFSLLRLTKLSLFPTSIQMIVVLCGKGVLGNLTVIARAAIAEAIKVETLEKFNHV